MSQIYLPGFALMPSMYSRLDLDENKLCIDLDARDSLDETITSLTNKIEPGSIAIGYSMGARLALATALREPSLFSGLVLISLNAGINDISERKKRFDQDRELGDLLVQNIDKGFERLDDSEVFETSEQNSDFIKENRIASTEILIKQIHALGLGSFDCLEDEMINLRIPVLYLSGSRDPKYCSLSAKYKKLTPFSHHRVVDSDHRVPINAPRTLSLQIKWFSDNVL